jgi:mRNA-degrading endonuclease RelE of RelBE toxin-antitoxin system
MTRDRMRAVGYRIKFAAQADEQIGDLTAHRRARLLEVIEKQLLHRPTVETRKRKPMQAGRRHFVAPWELRIDDMRVYYDVEETPEPIVVVTAIGIKVRDRVMIGGKEFES